MGSDSESNDYSEKEEFSMYKQPCNRDVYQRGVGSKVGSFQESL